MNKIDDANGNSVFELDIRKEGQLKIEFVRQTADQRKPCFMCKVLTPRVLTHKLSNNPVWDITWWCDFCFLGVQKMKTDYYGV